MLRDLRRLLRILTIAVMVMAIVQELQKPKEHRSWHGRVLGIIPFDLRFPTLERVAERVWNPEDPRLITEHPFGVGWTLNLATLAALVGEVAGQGSPGSA